MDAYRVGRPQPRAAPRAPWWRLVGAWNRGVFARIEERRIRGDMRTACRELLHLVAAGTHHDVIDEFSRACVRRFRGRHEAMMKILDEEMRRADAVTQINVSLARTLGEPTGILYAPPVGPAKRIYR